MASAEKPIAHQNQPVLKCPRCGSLNTKFCYYNNYNLSQPRHYCKACKRYWTRGGTLRNVPVGGGCRKNKRLTFATPDHSPNPNPNLHHSTPLYENPKYLIFNASVSSSDPFSNNPSDQTMSSLSASNLQQQPTYPGFAPYGDGGASHGNEVQTEIPKSRTDWNTSNLDGQNDNDQIFKALETSGPTSFLWAISGGDDGEWHDPTASDISVPSSSLI